VSRHQCAASKDEPICYQRRLASLGGSLFATYNGAVHPDSFSLGTLLDLLLMLFFGGEGPSLSLDGISILDYFGSNLIQSGDGNAAGI
jgi:hypothetical protein